MRKATIIDGITKLKSKAMHAMGVQQYSIRTYDTNCNYAELLREFKVITQINKSFDRAPTTNTVKHIIETEGQPVFGKPRRLTPDKYQSVKEEFQHLMKIGVCRPSKSPYASPLHVVRKADNTWRPCGDYRALNAQTLPDRYPLPHIQDFTCYLHGKHFFLKLICFEGTTKFQ